MTQLHLTVFVMNVEIIQAAVVEIPYACNAGTAIDHDARHNRNIRPPGPISCEGGISFHHTITPRHSAKNISYFSCRRDIQTTQIATAAKQTAAANAVAQRQVRRANIAKAHQVISKTWHSIHIALANQPKTLEAMPRLALMHLRF